ncbi:MAG: glycosyl transferase [Desulfobacterales bacterium]|nr:glycosyl transferase [Desulfobacterales bacterium]
MTDILPLFAFLACLVLTPVVRRMAMAYGWVAQPSQDRWHRKPTALMGGIAIYAGFSFPVIFLADFKSVLFRLNGTTDAVSLPSLAAVIWIGATAMFVLGLLDDFVHIKPQTKLVGQILAASMVTFLGFRLHWVTSMTLDTGLTLVWIIGITNAFNLLDNMDGLCAGVGAVTAGVLAVLFMDTSPHAAQIAMALAAALAAFLVYNFNPASIFMGDSGSLVIGFSLALLCLHYPETDASSPLAAWAVPIMVMLVPIFDTSLVTVVRLLSGRKASTGGRDHTSHRLVLIGLSERRAVLMLYGICAVAGASAVFVSRSDDLTSPAVIIPVALSILLMGIYLAQLRIYPEKEFSKLRGQTFTPVLVELTYKRQLVLVMLDLCLIAFAYYLSYRIRFDTWEFSHYFNVFLRSLPAVIACKFLAFFIVGVYRGIWGYMSTNDVYVYLKASTFATIMSVAAVTFIYRFQDFSKGIFFIDWMLTTGFLVSTRGSFRLFGDSMKRRTLTGKNVLIYGAGRGGEILLREILNNPKTGVRPVGFMDDDVLKKGKKLQGYTVLGTFGDARRLVERHGVGGILLSYHHADPERMAALTDFCRENGLFLKRFSIQLENMDVE